MHSEEPIETQFVASSQPDNADAAWRAEVASRVYSYQARRRRRYAGESAPALDFGPATDAETFGTESPHSRHTASASPAQPARAVRDTIRDTVLKAGGNAGRGSNAIDTNYYRRLNAESMAHGSIAEADVATAPEPEVEFQELSGNAPGDARDDAANEAWDQPLNQSIAEDAFIAPMNEREASEADRDPAANDSALDLEIRPTSASPLDGPCTAQPEPSALQGNLIVFPRPVLEPPLLPQPSRDELAEPMNRRPRILEVPEDIMPVVQGSLFPEIRLDGDEEDRTRSREPEIEVPLRVAPVSSRMMAGLADAGVTMAAGLLFAGMAWRALPDVPHTKPFWMMLGAVTLLLWGIYQHLFLLYAGRTPGMSMRGIRLSTFDGQTPPWSQRRRRARFMVISFAAVTLGFLWALVDEDELCWHDRLSQTFPTAE